MDAQDLVDQLHELGLSLKDFTELTEQPEGWCVRLVSGDDPIPHWVKVLVTYWVIYPNALDLARQMAGAERVLN